MKFSYVKRKNINTIPKTAGVYVFSKEKEILYIGKAINIRDRVKNHFHKSSYRDNLFIDQVTRVGWLETQSDIDALLLESQLIKSCQPKYNVMWKDDKGYFYVAITKEKLPRVFLTHQPERKSPVATPGRASLYRAHPKGSHMAITVARPPKTTQVVFGPFVDGKAIKQVLRLLRRVFPYYTAKKHPVLLCPYCHIGLCPGPNPDAKEYGQNIKNLVAVLRGRRISVLKNLKKSMERASTEQDFEKAAVLRDQVFSLENVASHAIRWQPSQNTALPKPWSEYTRIEAYDISNIQGKQSTGSMVTFLKGKPAKEWYRKFKIHPVIRPGAPSNDGAHPNDYAMIEQVISRRLKHTEWPYPDLMLIDGGKGQLSSTLKAISTLIRLSYPHLNRIKVVALAKRHNELFFPGKKESILLKDLPQKVSNLLLYIRDEAHRFAITYHRKLRKVDALKSS